MNTTLEPVPQPVQLVSQEEMSQIKKRQLMLKEEPQVQALAEKIDHKNQIAVLEFGKETATAISSFQTVCWPLLSPVSWKNRVN